MSSDSQNEAENEAENVVKGFDIVEDDGTQLNEADLLFEDADPDQDIDPDDAGDLETNDDDGSDESNEPKWDMDPIACMRRLEAVLFLARRPLTSRKLSQLAGLEDGTQARTMVANLNTHYDKVSRAFHVKKVGGGFQLLTRPQFFKWIRRLEHVPRPARVSAIMMETLSVVAYRQPIIKAEIEAIRGVSCGEILRQLLERGLVKIAGRSPELGRPFLYATSKEFLASFGFNSLDDLPRAELLAGEGLPQWVNPDHDSHSEIGTKEADSEDAAESSQPDDQQDE